MLQCGEDWSIRRIKLQDIKKLENKELDELVAASSISALRCLGADVELQTDSPLFDKVKSVVDSIKVVNDSAERSVALMSSWIDNKKWDRNAKTAAVVEDKRKRISRYQKTILKQYQTH